MYRRSARGDMTLTLRLASLSLSLSLSDKQSLLSVLHGLVPHCLCGMGQYLGMPFFALFNTRCWLYNGSYLSHYPSPNRILRGKGIIFSSGLCTYSSCSPVPTTSTRLSLSFADPTLLPAKQGVALWLVLLYTGKTAAWLDIHPGLSPYEPQTFIHSF